MATMVKEKRREKKKSKEKGKSRNIVETEHVSILSRNEIETGDLNEANSGVCDDLDQRELPQHDMASNVSDDINIKSNDNSSINVKGIEDINTKSKNNSHLKEIVVEADATTEAEQQMVQDESITYFENLTTKTPEQLKSEIIKNISLEASNSINTYKALNCRLERVTGGVLEKDLSVDVSSQHVIEFEKLEELDMENITTQSSLIQKQLENVTLEDVVPSAPMFEEEFMPTIAQEIIITETEPTVTCMTLEEAIWLFGGKEIAETKAMSEREEVAVEAGPVSGPEHPLVDLLSTFRSSLLALERERTQLTVGFIEEEKFRATLWKVEKRNIHLSKKCPCGQNVDLSASYEHAEFLKERLPVAKLRLESLMRDLQDSYCHHQHAALLAHSQIEELIYETVQSNKGEIREALALVLEALRLCDSDRGCAALPAALRRWARALAAALLDHRDPRQLLHLIHHLFRQTRSVRWAAGVVSLPAGDGTAAARALATLDLLLTHTPPDTATECTEESAGLAAGGEWEEVGARGAGGAVREGRLRERDLIALLQALPLTDMVARIVQFTDADIKRTTPESWHSSRGRGALFAACGARALLSVLGRARGTHAAYARLRRRLDALALGVLHALAGLHEHARSTYSRQLEAAVSGEMEACFLEGSQLLGPEQLQRLPTALLTEATARRYCDYLLKGLHAPLPPPPPGAPAAAAALPCAQRVPALAAIAHRRDEALATTVIQALVQMGVSQATAACGAGAGAGATATGGGADCAAAARAQLPRLLRARPELHAVALSALPAISQVQALPPSSVSVSRPGGWRPSDVEAVAMVTDWAARCPQLLPTLMLSLDYTPHSGISLDTQLALGQWMCWSGSEEWRWTVLMRMHLHRSEWGLSADAPTPDAEPETELQKAYTVLATTWGHSIPLICSMGVDALCAVAKGVGGAMAAARCLPPVMAALAASPDSVALTPRFEELLALILEAGPSLLQRAFRRGPAAGKELLMQAIVGQLDDESCWHARDPPALSWAAALWRPALPAAAPLLQAVAAAGAAQGRAPLDAHVGYVMRSSHAKEYMSYAISSAGTAPLLCEAALRGWAAARPAPRLLDALHAQRTTNQRIHVDNMFKVCGEQGSPEELPIYAAAAALSGGAPSPARLLLWRLFMQLYLERPPQAPSEATAPVGPLFFAGIIKSRTMAQLQKKLQDTVTYHTNERLVLEAKVKKDNAPASPVTESATSAEEPLLPELTILDLTGELIESESSDSESSDDESNAKEPSRSDSSGEVSSCSDPDDVASMIAYHAGAAKMCSEFLCWLRAGGDARAAPRHADVARYIPSDALTAAWRHELRSLCPRPPPRPSPAPPPRATPTALQATVATLLKIKDYSRKRRRHVTLRPPLGAGPRDARGLSQLVETHLADLDELARECGVLSSRWAALSASLWALWAGLRAPRAPPPVRRACRNKCKPLIFIVEEQEWGISTGAQRGIAENRAQARTVARRLASPRPAAARAAAALLAAAGRLVPPPAAVSLSALAWRRAGRPPQCAPQQDAVEAFFTLLAEKHISHDASVCADLLRRWCGAGAGSGTLSSLQQRLAGALVRPAAAPHVHWPALYMAVLDSNLPDHTVFSYLSKFDMSVWASRATEPQRAPVLAALRAAASRRGPQPSTEHQMLAELVGVHASRCLSAGTVCGYAEQCAHAVAAATLPPAHFSHVASAVRRLANDLAFDQLGQCLRTLGTVWWEARAAARPAGPAVAAAAAGPTADLLQALHQAFLSAGFALTYTPEKLCPYLWSSLSEAWAPWVWPHALPPLLATEDTRIAMLDRFVGELERTMRDCIGADDYFLEQVFVWAVQGHVGTATGNAGAGVSGGAGAGAARAQALLLLARLEGLPWERPWLGDHAVRAACQLACTAVEPELWAWCAARWRRAGAEGWLRGAAGAGGDRLAALLPLFTLHSHHQQTLDEASRLPWWELSEPALDAALDAFFQRHYSPERPYHELPQFRILLSACAMSYSPEWAIAGSGRVRRARFLASWARAGSEPALAKHVPGHVAAVLRTLAEIAPYLDPASDELEELLGREMALLCIEPAATAALPVFLQWLSSAAARSLRAALSAAARLTAFDHHLALTDAAIAAYMPKPECPGWSTIIPIVSSSPWASTLFAAGAARGRLHAAYAAERSAVHRHRDCRTALMAVMAADVDFVANEVIVAVWICLAARVARQCGANGAKAANAANGASAADAEAAECGMGAASVVSRWAGETRRSILRMVTMQTDTGQPTAQHRLLCRLALCIITPEAEGVVKAYEACCASVLGSTPDVLAWGKNPRPKHLPRLAMRLYPAAEKYFKDELDLAPDD